MDTQCSKYGQIQAASAHLRACWKDSNLSLTLDLPNQNPHLDKIPGDLCAQNSLRSTVGELWVGPGFCVSTLTGDAAGPH